MNAMHWFRDIPRAPGAPQRTLWDWALLVLFVPLMLTAWTRRETELLWPWVTLLLGFGIAAALFYRRSAPGLTTILTFGSVAVLELAARSQGLEWDGLEPFILLVVVAYSLPRWGSGPEIAAGSVAILSAYLMGSGIDLSEPGESIAGATILLFPLSLGAVFRSQDRHRRRAQAELLLRERTDLARELHDSVAHHVAAIAVQAQGARALAKRKPEATVDALAAIEESAARALEEMRRVVGALRDDDAPERRPLGTIADLERLAAPAGAGPEVRVTLRGDLDGLDASLQHTLYSIAREGITNAIRHATGARNIDVSVEADRDRLLLTVTDDGRSGAEPGNGFGLRGMRERVKLLGGALVAGPGDTGGWRIAAELPREAPA